jgi:hypothetical protein
MDNLVKASIAETVKKRKTGPLQQGISRQPLGLKNRNRYQN